VKGATVGHDDNVILALFEMGDRRPKENVGVVEPLNQGPEQRVRVDVTISGIKVAAVETPRDRGGPLRIG
jgi:hypothetical protein